MNQRGRIRLSTMEIVLIAALLGSLVLAMIQARQQELRNVRKGENHQ